MPRDMYEVSVINITSDKLSEAIVSNDTITMKSRMKTNSVSDFLKNSF